MAAFHKEVAGFIEVEEEDGDYIGRAKGLAKMEQRPLKPTEV